MRFFSLQISPFSRTVSGIIVIFMCLFFVHIFNSFGLAIVALSNMHSGDFFCEKFSKKGNFHQLLVLATECLFSFHPFEIHNDSFLGWFFCGHVNGTYFLVSLFIFLKYDFLCVLDAIFIAEANLRCGVFFPKKLSSHNWQFIFFFGLDYQIFLVFINFKDNSGLLGLVVYCLLVNGT